MAKVLRAGCTSNIREGLLELFGMSPVLEFVGYHGLNAILVGILPFDRGVGTCGDVGRVEVVDILLWISLVTQQ
jgi:hypothetical protein